MNLSILDLSHPSDAVELVEEAAAFGYTRYWIGEHHSPSQCANPLLLGAVLALANPALRVGSGGVCLTLHSSLQVAEDARLVETMIPGRLDLGVTRGMPLSRALSKELLDGRKPLDQAGFFEKASHLHRLLSGQLTEDHPMFGHWRVGVPAPPMWLLGLSPESARWAGAHGTGFAFSLHHNHGRHDSRAVLQEYFKSFQPSREFPEPAALIVVSGICAPTFEELETWRRSATLPKNLEDVVLGTPPDFLEALERISREHRVDEVMILDLLQMGSSERLEMYRALGQMSGMAASSAGRRERGSEGSSGPSLGATDG